MARELRRHKLTLALINCPPPNYTDPDAPRGFAAVPGHAERFRSDFRRSLRYARTLGAERVHVMAGVAEGPEAGAVFADNLAWACAEAPEQLLTIEPLNGHDVPGYFLDDYDLALSVLDDVAAPNLSLQFDTYHAARLTGNVVALWEAVGPRVGHVQVGDHPGRHEPGSGEIDFGTFFAQLRRDGYAGWVSGEYVPAGRTAAGLGWRRG
ncbi:hypothetical protein OG2516_16921 [Oceanicola granulosus HTCC2516]|uniref:Xylose isomerase-like TIM barrel domain-containing protein n=1 Tax=Oceanicola granulosus (strain ATCC BAA-861 / DSM 15982 / KCTC 12143 / HTCC2516) TaxID=314256 RepID=Q2CFQ9_OCEGH|nr:hypothetical protein OG2516_16921 [Oceanicola granulosus HTCC2516]